MAPTRQGLRRARRAAGNISAISLASSTGGVPDVAVGDCGAATGVRAAVGPPARIVLGAFQLPFLLPWPTGCS